VTDSFHSKVGSTFVEAIGPALIMLMIGCLAFFLIDVAYVGAYDVRIKYIVAIFVFAATLVSRISIIDGYERAAVFGAALALAMMIVLSRFALALAPVVLLLWWCVGRLTWDCTFIDSSRDVSAVGLADIALGKVRRAWRRWTGDEPVAASTAPELTAPESDDLIRRGVEDEAARDEPARRRHWLEVFWRRRQPNTPGLWVLVFLVAGVPLFGFGQLMISPQNPAASLRAVPYCAGYMLAGLGLLMFTSLLGLYRYLDQRRIELPSPVARWWLIAASAIALSTIIVALVLPRPVPSLGIASWLPRVTSTIRQASRAAFGRDGKTSSDRPQVKVAGGPANQNSDPPAKSAGSEGSSSTPGQGSPGKSGAKSDSQTGTSGANSSGSGSSKGSGQQSGEKSSSGQSSSKSGNAPANSENQSQGKGKANSAAGQPPDQKDSSAKSDSQTDPGNRAPQDQASRAEQANSPQDKQSSDSRARTDQQQSARRSSAARSSPSGSRSSANANRSPSPSSLASGALGFLRLIAFFVLAGFVLWAAWKFRESLMRGLRELLADLQKLWMGLWRRKPKTSDEPTASSVAMRRFPGFADFVNPFASNMVSGWPPARTVAYTFAALEAWARDRKCPRPDDVTPQEFARATRRQFRILDRSILDLAEMYNELAYAGADLSPQRVAGLERLWAQLAETAHAAPEDETPREGAASTAAAE